MFLTGVALAQTRSEIRALTDKGHIVGMTCGSEWILAAELMMPYALVCAVDNCCSGLSTRELYNDLPTCTCNLMPG